MPHSDFQSINFGGKNCSIYSVKYCKSLHCDLNSFYLAAGTGALPIYVTGIFYWCFWPQRFQRSLQEFHRRNPSSISWQSAFIYLIYCQNLHYESFHYWGGGFSILFGSWFLINPQVVYKICTLLWFQPLCSEVILHDHSTSGRIFYSH